MRLAILDDYQGASLKLGPWDRLAGKVEATVFRDTLHDEDALVDRLEPFEAIFAIRERTAFPASLLRRLPKLKLLMSAGERNKSFDLAAAQEAGITVCGTTTPGAPTVDITWGLILCLLRGIPHQQQALRSGHWQTFVGGATAGRTLGVIGLGKLGSKVAQVGQAFGMRVIAWSQNLTDEAAAAVGVERVSKSDLLEQSDVVTLHLVLSDRSRGLIGGSELSAMKSTAYLVNTSRGPLIDKDALISALKTGAIAGAGLDVFDEEPLPPDDPILDAPNTVLTPHLGYVTEENYRAYFTGAVEDIEAFLDGKPIRLLQG